MAAKTMAVIARAKAISTRVRALLGARHPVHERFPLFWRFIFFNLQNLPPDVGIFGIKHEVCYDKFLHYAVTREKANGVRETGVFGRESFFYRRLAISTDRKSTSLRRCPISSSGIPPFCDVSGQNNFYFIGIENVVVVKVMTHGDCHFPQVGADRAVLDIAQIWTVERRIASSK